MRQHVAAHCRPWMGGMEVCAACEWVGGVRWSLGESGGRGGWDGGWGGGGWHSQQQQQQDHTSLATADSLQ